MTDEPTRPNLKDPSKTALIELILCNRRDKVTASWVFALGLSDHCPVACIRRAGLAKSVMSGSML